MALPWLALIKAVPWTEVVAHAPAVLSAAKKLWQPKPGERPQPLPDGEGRGTGDGPAAPGQGASALRVAALESQVAELTGQLATTNQLVQDMAEQQARMLVQVEAQRQTLSRLRWVAVVALVLAAVAVVRVFSAA